MPALLHPSLYAGAGRLAARKKIRNMELPSAALVRFCDSSICKAYVKPVRRYGASLHNYDRLQRQFLADS